MSTSVPAAPIEVALVGSKRRLDSDEPSTSDLTESVAEKRQHLCRASKQSEASTSPTISSITIPSPFTTESLVSDSSIPISPLATTISFDGLSFRQYLCWVAPQVCELPVALLNIVAEYVEGVKFPLFPPLPSKYRSTHKDVYESCKQGDLNQLRYLIEVKQEPFNSIYGFGCSGARPIHLAAMAGHLSCLQYLIYRGVAASTPIHNGQTSLCLSAFHGKEGIANYLLSFHNTLPPASLTAGGPTRLCDVLRNDGLSCLHAAACGGLGSLIVRLATEFGLDPCDVSQADSWTPLHRAAHYGRLDAVRALVDELKVDPSPKDSSGRTPLAQARSNNRTEIVAFLESRGAH